MEQSPSWEANGFQLVKFPAFYGIRRFITAFTSAHYLSLSWASPIQSILPHPTSSRSILILSSHLRLGLQSGVREISQQNYSVKPDGDCSVSIMTGPLVRPPNNRS